MARHSSTLAWKIPWMEEPGRLQSMGCKESDTTEQLHLHFSLSCIEEGNGNPLQCSCLENPRDGGAWLAAVYGVTQSRTRLKQLSSSSSWYSCLQNSIDRGAWQATALGVTKSWTGLSDLTQQHIAVRPNPDYQCYDQNEGTAEGSLCFINTKSM